MSRSLSPSEDEGDRQIHPTSDHKSKITGTEREEQRRWEKPRTDASILLSVPSDGLLRDCRFCLCSVASDGPTESE